MALPAVIPEETIIQGTSWVLSITLLDSDKNPVDLTVTGVGLVLRLKPRNGEDVITRTMGASGETVFSDDGTDGGIDFLFTAAETADLTAGVIHDVEIIYTNSNTLPETKIVWAAGNMKVQAPRTGAI